MGIISVHPLLLRWQGAESSFGTTPAFWGQNSMGLNLPQRPCAKVYFDGFNFYYGCFKNSNRRHWQSYKWLDLAAFIQKVFPNYSINRIRYFTALVNSNPLDPGQQTRQLTYLRALQTIPNLSVHQGRFARTAKKRWEADPRSFLPPYKPVIANPIRTVGVIEEEEKGSDVNLASYILIDGFAGEYDIGVIISNDSDLAEPIRLVKSVMGLKVALLNPRAQTATDLQGIADVYRTIRLGPIMASQFPSSLTDANGIITRPTAW